MPSVGLRFFVFTPCLLNILNVGTFYCNLVLALKQDMHFS